MQLCPVQRETKSSLWDVIWKRLRLNIQYFCDFFHNFFCFSISPFVAAVEVISTQLTLIFMILYLYSSVMFVCVSWQIPNDKYEKHSREICKIISHPSLPNCSFIYTSLIDSHIDDQGEEQLLFAPTKTPLFSIHQFYLHPHQHLNVFQNRRNRNTIHYTGHRLQCQSFCAFCGCEGEVLFWDRFLLLSEFDSFGRFKITLVAMPDLTLLHIIEFSMEEV